MIHAALLAAGIIAIGAYGLAIWAAVRSWNRTGGLRAHIADWLVPDPAPVMGSGWRAALVRWTQVALAILVMPIATLVLIAAILALSVGMVLLTLTAAALCGCALLIARAAVERTSAPGL